MFGTERLSLTLTNGMRRWTDLFPVANFCEQSARARPELPAESRR
jgi:hypothetical protein